MQNVKLCQIFYILNNLKTADYVKNVKTA